MARHTENQRREAINLYIQHGTTRASELSGVPKRTILYWAKNANVVAQARDKTAEATKTLQRINHPRAIHVIRG